jgi:cytochrome c peroxidase
MRKSSAFRTAPSQGEARRFTARVLVTMGALGVAGAALAAVVLFPPFRDDSGLVQSATADITITGKNKFFDPGLGTNGQACSTCHQPFQGFTLSVDEIQDAFAATDGLDPIFRPNDTADRPDADVSTPAARTVAYRTVLALGVTRIAKTLPAGANFTVAPQDTPRFGPLPNPSDPSAPPGSHTLSLFRRPLVNTNVHFDSAVLWDGRASITDMPGQVKRAARGLLLAGGPTAGALGNVSDADAAEVANFMLQVYSDQVRDNLAGSLSALDATGGVQNLLALASDPLAPCTPLAPSSTCTPIVPDNSHTMTLFDSWAGLTSGGSVSAARAAIARGQAVFNNATLHVPADMEIPGLAGNVAHCVTCHATNNLGNNPASSFFVRIGTDSPEVLTALAAQNPELDVVLERSNLLPEYCLRPTSDPTPFSVSPCGDDAGDVRTTDPGHALVSGAIADAGRFKPPILRGLAARSPYFHNGVAGEIEQLVDFYDTRFQIGLSDQDRADLAAFLEAM